MNAKQKPIFINLNIGDQLTSISCGHVVVEIIKFLAYQRLQIPYTYQWLKQVVTKKKMSENEDTKDSFQSERHFRIASTALENLDFILKSLLSEINGHSMPEEICIALGGSPISCKEAYRLIMPTVCHKPQCQSPHIANDQKIQRNIFRTLVTSDALSKVFFSSIAQTNMFVYIKKKITDSPEVVNNENFVTTSGCRIPRNSRVVVLDLRSTNTDNITCCNDFQVFGDAISQELKSFHIDDENEEDFHEIECTDSIIWYESSYVMKGFKDSVVNGASVTNDWLQS